MINEGEQGYLDLLRHILENGKDRGDRTGVGTRGVFGAQLCFDLTKGFPLLTTKKMFLKGIVHELLWILSGDTNVKYLQDNGVRIWDEWADENGDLGPVYGHQWRNFAAKCTFDPVVPLLSGFDQIKWVVEEIQRNPNSRRLIVTGWNPHDVPAVALPPCHTLFQFYVQDGELSCQLYQRSGDMFLGVPFNIASYALLTMMVAQVTGLRPGEFVHTFGDAHIYRNHFDQVREQLERHPLGRPKMVLNAEVKDIFSFKYEDFQLQDYSSWPAIKAPVAV